ncbi:hypothetical protein P3X46_003248 [Hevea brasiliensis]|uniref:GATA-type domain-containing protein n=1 Tax=Hevea brasiliensis TaxID=3981 RepID=A0ABQ9N6C3_HEVBR|nr:GATA transcription factor 16 [Hevea brasiliensis]KAJ9187833.1 hypothetical protein P3X46_003248 [Hevea brasiliensis]
MMIVDLNTNGQESEGIYNTSPAKGGELKKSCIDCHTTRTPCWRSGPEGPKTLCNACGIRYRKKRWALLGLDKGRAEKCRRKMAKSSRSKLGVSLELGLMVPGRDILLQEEWKRRLGEEEQAAILLMALSCGCVSA